MGTDIKKSKAAGGSAFFLLCRRREKIMLFRISQKFIPGFLLFLFFLRAGVCPLHLSSDTSAVPEILP